LAIGFVLVSILAAVALTHGLYPFLKTDFSNHIDVREAIATAEREASTPNRPAPEKFYPPPIRLSWLVWGKLELVKEPQGTFKVRIGKYVDLERLVLFVVSYIILLIVMAIVYY
jgi:hypothetical protein